MVKLRKVKTKYESCQRLESYWNKNGRTFRKHYRSHYKHERDILRINYHLLSLPETVSIAIVRLNIFSYMTFSMNEESIIYFDKYNFLFDSIFSLRLVISIWDVFLLNTYKAKFKRKLECILNNDTLCQSLGTNRYIVNIIHISIHVHMYTI